MTMTNETVLQEAQRLVHGDRGASYGHPYDDYAATSAMWRAMIQRRYGVDVPMSPDFACLMMVAVKLSRECGKPKRDNRVDGPGYFECADMCLDREEQLKSIESLTAPAAAIFGSSKPHQIDYALGCGVPGDAEEKLSGTPGMTRVGRSLKPDWK